MGIKTIIDQSGVTSKSGHGTQISADPTGNSGFLPFAMGRSGSLGSTALGGTFTLTGPGFYQVSGSTACTGTVPDPALFPGAMLFVAVVNPQPCQLSGSTSTSAKVFGFSGLAATGSLGAANVTQRGNIATLTSNGTVGFWSDGNLWLAFVSSGSIALSP